MAGDDRDLDRRLHWLLFGEEGGDATPDYTTNLEAAFDLMRRRFPGWWFSIRTTDERPEVWIAIDLRHPTYGWHFPDSWRELPDDPAEDGPGLAVSFPFGTPPALCMSLAMANVARDIDLGRNPQADPDILDHLAGRSEPFDLSVLPSTGRMRRSRRSMRLSMRCRRRGRSSTERSTRRFWIGHSMARHILPRSMRRWPWRTRCCQVGHGALVNAGCLTMSSCSRITRTPSTARRCGRDGGTS